MGIARISHIDRSLAGETALARTLGLKRFPSNDTLYTLLKKVTLWHVKQVDRIHQDDLTEQTHYDEAPVIADLDLSSNRPRDTSGRGPLPVTTPSTRAGIAPGPAHTNIPMR